MLPNPVLTVFLLLCLLPVSPAQKPPSSPPDSPSAHIPLDGARIFQNHCATCHGADGSGHGPASSALKESLQDLRLLSQRNGGNFPEQHTKDIIEGKQPAPPAHGSREMPIWGPIFHQIEADEDWEKSGWRRSRSTWNLSSKNSEGLGLALFLTDALFDPGHKFRRMALHQLFDPGPEFMPHIHARVIAHGRTKIADRTRRRPSPRGTRGRVRSHRSQRAQQIRSVQPAFSGFIPRDKNTRSRIGGPAHQAAVARRAMTR